MSKGPLISRSILPNVQSKRKSSRIPTTYDGSIGALSPLLVATHRFPRHRGSPTSVGTREVRRKYIQSNISQNCQPNSSEQQVQRTTNRAWLSAYILFLTRCWQSSSSYKDSIIQSTKTRHTPTRPCERVSWLCIVRVTGHEGDWWTSDVWMPGLAHGVCRTHGGNPAYHTIPPLWLKPHTWRLREL